MHLFITFQFFVAALCLPSPRNEAIKVPLSRRASATRSTSQVDPTWFFGELQYTLNKYGLNITFPYNGGVKDIIKRSIVGKEPLQDQVEGGDLDELYLGSITVGKRSGQTFSCDFDTGSADLFVPGPKCDTSQGCPGTTKYNQGGTDEKSTTTITYGSGMVTGENFYDSVTVSGLTAAHQNVISLTQATGFSGSDASSLMGMAFSSIAQSRKPTYFETLMAQNIVTTPEFSFYLGRAADGTQGNSELTLGGRNTAKFSGPVTMVPVTSQTYWQVAIDGVAVAVAVTQLLKPVSVAGTSGQAAIDTGTTLIIAPTQAAANIYKSIPGSFEVSLLGGPAGFYAYPCALKPNVQLQFNGVKLAINPKDFSFGTLTTTFANFMGSSSLARECI